MNSEDYHICSNKQKEHLAYSRQLAIKKIKENAKERLFHKIFQKNINKLCNDICKNFDITEDDFKLILDNEISNPIVIYEVMKNFIDTTFDIDLDD